MADAPPRETRDQPSNAHLSHKALPLPTDVGRPSGKDPWDKFSTVSTILSAILIATVGGYFTHRFEERQAKEQRKIQETQAVAQLMPYLTGTDQQQKRAFVAIKALGDTQLMVELAASDPKAPGAREALRNVEFYAGTQGERNLAINVLSQFEFAPACTLPFQSIALAHPIDFSEQSCGMPGDSPSDNLRLQNLAKNNFCAGTNYRDLSPSDFVALQQQADARVGSGNPNASLPSDRGVLKKLYNGIGEGSAVRFTGYIMNARYSNVAIGESVNCKTRGVESNDIHINLVNKPDEGDSCQSITAEISPHMRPAKWEPEHLAPIMEEKVLVRIAGQLLYDASHKPCGGGERANPPRLTTWEIHPVYSIETCRSAQQGICPQNQWVPLAPPPTE
jgi:hypothetical protein